MLGIWIALGGAAGAWMRYALGGLIRGFTGTNFPWDTMAVNVIGSLLLGMLALLSETIALSEDVRTALTIGVLGAFTTFSAMSYETVRLAQEGQWLRAGGYSLGSLALGLAAVVVGFRIASLILSARG